MTPELTILMVEKILRYGPDIISKMILSLGRPPSLDEIRELGITKKPEDYFKP